MKNAGKALKPDTWDHFATTYDKRKSVAYLDKEGWQPSEIGLRELPCRVNNSGVISPFLCDLQKFPPLRNGIRGMIL